MTRDLDSLTFPQLVALGWQNNIDMKLKPTRASLTKALEKLTIIKGLETKENGQPTPEPKDDE